MEGITIAGEERQALYRQLLNHLSGIGDIYVALSSGDIENARELRQHYADATRLLDDLGWAEEDPEPPWEYAITLPADQLVRVLRRLNELAGDVTRTHIDGSVDEAEAAKESATSAELIGRLLADLAEHVTPQTRVFPGER